MITMSEMVSNTVNMIDKTLKDKNMKEKIIQIIGSEMEPERRELKAMEIIMQFNSHIISTFRESKDLDQAELLNNLFINL